MNSDHLYEKYSNSTGGNLYNVANTDKGNYYFRNLDHSSKEDFCFGPYENFFIGYSGYAYKENGKWGVKLKKVLSSGSNSTETKYIPFLPAKYDAEPEPTGVHLPVSFISFIRMKVTPSKFSSLEGFQDSV